MDEASTRSKLACLARYAVVEAQSNANDQVRHADSAIDVRWPMHARHAKRQRVRFRKSAQAQQGSDDRDVGLFGKGAQFVIRFRQDDAVTRHNEWTFGLSN